jgi:hypothetical protein
MKDEFAIAANEIGEGGLTEALTIITKDIISLTKENKELAHALGKTLGDALLFVRNNFELLRNVLVGLAIGSTIASFGRLATGIAAVTTATKLLTAAARANPYIAAATAVAIGLGFLADKLGLFSDANADAAESVETNSKAVFTIHDGYKQSTGSIVANTVATGDNTKFKYDNAAATDAQSTAQTKLMDKMRKQYEMVLLYNESELEANYRKELKEIEQMDEALKTGAINYEEYERARTEIANKYSSQRSRIENKAIQEQNEKRRAGIDLFKQGKYAEADIAGATEQEKKEIAISTARDTLDVLASQNKKFFELQKAVKIADAIQNTYVGATKAFAMGGPLGFITAGLVVAAGMAQVNAIRSQQYPGRKFGGQVMAGQSYTVGENGQETFTPSSTGMISPNSQSGGRTEVNVNFNINAVDSSSFDNLLVERRDTIVGVINQALNENGQRSLV